MMGKIDWRELRVVNKNLGNDPEITDCMEKVFVVVDAAIDLVLANSAESFSKKHGLLIDAVKRLEGKE